jgi:hypothetical protein
MQCLRTAKKMALEMLVAGERLAAISTDNHCRRPEEILAMSLETMRTTGANLALCVLDSKEDVAAYRHSE